MYTFTVLFLNYNDVNGLMNDVNQYLSTAGNIIVIDGQFSTNDAGTTFNYGVTVKGG